MNCSAALDVFFPVKVYTSCEIRCFTVGIVFEAPVIDALPVGMVLADVLQVYT